MPGLSRPSLFGSATSVIDLVHRRHYIAFNTVLSIFKSRIYDCGAILCVYDMLNVSRCLISHTDAVRYKAAMLLRSMVALYTEKKQRALDRR